MTVSLIWVTAEERSILAIESHDDAGAKLKGIRIIDDEISAVFVHLQAQNLLDIPRDCGESAFFAQSCEFCCPACIEKQTVNV